MTRKKWKSDIKSLQIELQEKLRLFDSLKEENALLHVKHRLLKGLCETLAHVRQQSDLSPDIADATECLLLEQLSGSYCDAGTAANGAVRIRTASSTAASAHAKAVKTDSRQQLCQVNSRCSLSSTARNDLRAAFAVHHRSKALPAVDEEDASKFAAPADDPLFIARVCMTQPTDLAERSPTMQELLDAAAQMAREMAYYLQIHELGTYKVAYAADDPARPQPIQQMRAAFFECFGPLSQVCLKMRGDLVTDMPLTSYDGSGMVLKEHNMTLYRQLVRQLGLTPSQLQHLALGITVLQELWVPILLETRNLQQQIASEQVVHCYSSETDNLSTNGTSSCDRGFSSTADHPSSHPGQPGRDLATMHSSLFLHLGRNNEQEEKLARMRILLGKEVILRASLMGFVLGHMTWPQIAKAIVGVAKAIVGTSPFLLGLLPLATALLEYNEEVNKSK